MPGFSKGGVFGNPGVQVGITTLGVYTTNSMSARGIGENCS